MGTMHHLLPKGMCNKHTFFITKSLFLMLYDTNVQIDDTFDRTCMLLDNDASNVGTPSVRESMAQNERRWGWLPVFFLVPLRLLV